MQCANQDTSASLLERSLETNLHMQVVNKLRNHHERMLRYVLNCSNTAGAQTQHAPDHLFPFGEEPAQGAGDHGIRSSHSHSRDSTSTPALLAQQHDKQLNRIHTNNLLTTWANYVAVWRVRWAMVVTGGRYRRVNAYASFTQSSTHNLS